MANKKLKWKRTRDGQIVFKERKSLAETFRNVGYMQVSLMTFAASAFFFLCGLAWAAFSNGGAAIWIVILWFLSLAAAIGGIAVTRYGHYTVEAESRLSWRVGMYTNGGMILLLCLIYLIGLIPG